MYSGIYCGRKCADDAAVGGMVLSADQIAKTLANRQSGKSGQVHRGEAYGARGRAAGVAAQVRIIHTSCPDFINASNGSKLAQNHRVGIMCWGNAGATAVQVCPPDA
jgi:hypothetical protein